MASMKGEVSLLGEAMQGKGIGGDSYLRLCHR